MVLGIFVSFFDLLDVFLLPGKDLGFVVAEVIGKRLRSYPLNPPLLFDLLDCLDVVRVSNPVGQAVVCTA